MHHELNTSPDDWAALHVQLQDLLAGYADDALGEQQFAIIQAHLVACEACRKDVARQRALHQRLNEIPVLRMPTEFHARLDEALMHNATGVEKTPRLRLWRRVIAQRVQRIAAAKQTFTSASGWAVSLLLAIIIIAPSIMPANERQAPMVQDVLVDYQQMANASLPISASLATVSAPAHWRNARLLATWTTVVGGAPAQAYALRSGRNIVVLYRIDEAVLFRNPMVRREIAQNGAYRTQVRNTQVLALPLNKAGLLMVGPVDAMPSPEQLTFKT